MLFDDLNDDQKDPTDEDLAEDEEDAKSHESHTIANVDILDDTLEEDVQFKEPIGSPSVIGEEDPLSGSATDGEPVDIDDHRKAMGLNVDEADEIPKPLGED